MNTRAFKLPNALTLVGFVLLITVGYFFYKDRWPDWDEPYYLDMINAIKDLIHGHRLGTVFSLYATPKFSGITTLPTYYIAAAYLNIAAPTYQALRLINVVLLAGTVFLWDRIQVLLYGVEDRWKVAQLVFFPVVFTMAYLIYTDFTSLFFVCLAFHLELRNRFSLSAFSLFLAVIIRQSVAPWIVLIPALVYLHRNRITFTKTFVMEMLREQWGKLLLLVITGAFFIYNHGVSMGARDLQVTGKFSIGNLSNYYLFAALFFFPSIIRSFEQHCLVFRRSQKALASAVAGFGVYWVGLKQPLHYCNSWIEHRGTYFIRNNVVQLQRDHLWIAVCAYIVIVFGVLELHRKIRKDISLLLAATVFITLAPFNIIDIRYAILTFCFFVVFREEPESNVKKLQTIWIVFLSWLWLYGVVAKIWTPF